MLRIRELKKQIKREHTKNLYISKIYFYFKIIVKRIERRTLKRRINSSTKNI